MSSHLEKAISLAGKISAKAEQTLAGIDREMTIMKWPDEYRAIIVGSDSRCSIHPR
jgi:hypothetical protein